MCRKTEIKSERKKGRTETERQKDREKEEQQKKEGEEGNRGEGRLGTQRSRKLSVFPERLSTSQ